jgi:putative SOS response-associated peptidase YedK
VIKTAKELEHHYRINAIYGNLEKDRELIYHYANGFAHPVMWILPQQRRGHMIPVMWGLIPHYELGANAKEYYKKTLPYGSGLNARSENLFESNNYKNSVYTKRCVIPVDGFYETHSAKKNGKDFNVPFYFHRKNEGMIHLAGIYAVTQDKMVSFTVLTKAATPLFAKIHNKKQRRPVILNDDDVDRWLDDTIREDDILAIIDNDLTDASIYACPISKDLYKKNGEGDRVDIITPVHYEEITIEY